MEKLGTSNLSSVPFENKVNPELGSSPPDLHSNTFFSWSKCTWSELLGSVAKYYNGKLNKILINGAGFSVISFIL